MAQILSIKELRNKLADVVASVEHTGEEVIITKFGRARAIIVPISESKTLGLGKFEGVFGVWKERADIHNSGKWVKDVKTIGSMRKK